MFEQLLAVPVKGSGGKNILLSQQRAKVWRQTWREDRGFLPLFEPSGSAKAMVELARAWMAPLKRWLAAAAAALAGELAERYRVWRFARGVQTYADQVPAILAQMVGGDRQADRHALLVVRLDPQAHGGDLGEYFVEIGQNLIRLHPRHANPPPCCAIFAT